MGQGNFNIWARALIEQNQRWLFSFFLTATGNPATAEDLVQEVFATALTKQDDFDPARSFGAWLRGIARRKLMEHYRQTQRTPLGLNDAALDRLDDLADASWRRNADPQVREGRMQTLRECLAELTERARKILQLKYHHRLASKEVAERVLMTVPSVDMALSRARQALADCVERQWREAAHG